MKYQLNREKAKKLGQKQGECPTKLRKRKFSWEMSHADRFVSKLTPCRGVRRIVQCLNMLLRVQAPDEQYLDIVQHGSLQRANVHKYV